MTTPYRTGLERQRPPRYRVEALAVGIVGYRCDTCAAVGESDRCEPRGPLKRITGRPRLRGAGQ